MQLPLRVEELQLQAERRILLETLSFELKAGERLAVIGPNGAGKTSLLRALAGDLSPVQGRVILQGQAIDDLSLQERARRLAVLPQLSGLNFPFSVAEVVMLGRSPHASGAKRDAEIVREAMLSLGVLHLQERLYTKLSGGEKQRVQLARVLAQLWPETSGEGRQASVLLLDEPSSALDLGHQRLLGDVLKHLAEDGLSCVMAIHDLNVAAAWADRILALRDGRCIGLGSPEEIINPALLQELFGVSLQVIRHPDSGRPVALGS